MFFYNESVVNEAFVDAEGWTRQYLQTWEDADVDYISSGELSYNDTSTQTTTVAHTSLSNPYLFGGNNARHHYSTHLAYHMQRLYPNREDLLGSNISNSISLRFALRASDIKGHIRVEFRGRNDDPATINQAGHKITLYDGWSYSSPGRIVFGTFSQTAYPLNEWKLYRCDLEPQIVNGVWTEDKISLYSADADSETPNWTLLHQQNFSNISPDNLDYRYHQLTWHSYTSSAIVSFHMDNFEVYTR